MALNMNTINGTLNPIGNRVLVTDMYFGEQRTRGGLIISDDDGQTRGIYPRWGRVHAKGPDNNESYEVGDWVLVEHGRWTRSVKIDEGDGEQEIRMIEAESILGYSHTKPDDVHFGVEYSNGDSATFSPESFVRA
jgi:co-chaperonin GroES (HSP10)